MDKPPFETAYTEQKLGTLFHIREEILAPLDFLIHFTKPSSFSCILFMIK
jgi:hypothetical protein